MHQSVRLKIVNEALGTTACFSMVGLTAPPPPFNLRASLKLSCHKNCQPVGLEEPNVPVDLEILPRASLGYLRFRRVVTPAEYIGCIRRLFDAPEMSPETQILADLSRVEGVTADFKQLLTIAMVEARLSASVAPGTAYAFIAPDDGAFDACRMFEQIAEATLPYRISVCRREAEALRFLGRPERTVADLLRLAD